MKFQVCFACSPLSRLGLGFKFLIVLVFSLFLIECKKGNELNQKNISKVEIKNNFFETIDSVRLISYPSKMTWNKREIMTDEDVDFDIPKDKIIDNVILNKDEFKKVKDVLTYDYKNDGYIADCYEPRHLLQFYKNDEIIANYEICLECGSHQKSKNLDFLPSFCIQKGEELKETFKRMGLKNYGEGSPFLDKLE